MMNFQTISMGAIAFAVLAGSAVAFTAEDAKEATHDGTIVSISITELVMTGKDEKEHTHTITDNTIVTCDKKDCKATDLKAGTKIRVTTKKSDENAVTCIEAIVNDGDFAR